MGFGKYTQEERKIVNSINDLLRRRSHYLRMAESSEFRINELIAKLGGKYQRKT